MVTIVLNHQPYDGSDITWNALRLADTLHKNGEDVNIFLMNDAVDLARDKSMKPQSYDYDLVDMLKKCMLMVLSFKHAVHAMRDVVFLKMSLTLMRISLQLCKF